MITTRMSIPADHSYLGTAQSRRSACDRCHQHKLKCERSDTMVDGDLEIPLTPCKRCLKANVPCQTAVNGNKGNASRGSKRRMISTEAEKVHERASITASSVPPSSWPPASAVMYGTSSGGSSMFNMDSASLLDLVAFDFEASDFTGLDTTTSPTSILEMTQGASEDDHLATQIAQDTPDVGISEADCEKHVNSTLFSGRTPRQGGSISTASNHSLSSVLITEPESPPTTRNDCRSRLLSLHSMVFNELHCITDSDLADALLSDDCTSLGHRESGCHGNSFVSRLLSASEWLIELLRKLRVAFASQPGRRDSPGTSSSRLHQRSASLFLSTPLHHRPSLRSSLPGTPTVSSHSSSDNTSTSSPSPSPLLVDLPIVISFLTCYVGLLAVYRAVLTQILLSLRSTEQQQHRMRLGGGPVLPTPGSRRGSVHTASGSAFGPLEGGGGGNNNLGQVLRMRIQTEVMTHMIERIEDAWVAAMMDGNSNDEDEQLYHHRQQNQGGRRNDVGIGVLFGRTETIELLQKMLVYEGFNTREDEGWRAGQRSLIELLKMIRRLLRSSNFT
ncbi:hypothetical protein HD806DRAFT_515980 [Xylariaceae sp. AK1471]|nr:hypothetical protein HD806DRAFT_515980 [Xylariaceae sp. AK1471]